MTKCISMHSFPSFEPGCCCMSSSNYHFLTCIQVYQEAGQLVWYSHLFPVCCDPHSFHCSQWSRCFFGIPFFFFFYDSTNVGNLISGSSAFSKSSLYIWKFSVHILLKSSLKDCEHYLAHTWNEHNRTVVWTFFGIGFPLGPRLFQW